MNVDSPSDPLPDPGSDRPAPVHRHWPPCAERFDFTGPVGVPLGEVGYCQVNPRVGLVLVSLPAWETRFFGSGLALAEASRGSRADFDDLAEHLGSTETFVSLTALLAVCHDLARGLGGMAPLSGVAHEVPTRGEVGQVMCDISRMYARVPGTDPWTLRMPDTDVELTTHGEVIVHAVEPFTLLRASMAYLDLALPSRREGLPLAPDSSEVLFHTLRGAHLNRVSGFPRSYGPPEVGWVNDTPTGSENGPGFPDPDALGPGFPDPGEPGCRWPGSGD